MWEYNATLSRVVDGDTVVLRVDLGFHISVVEKFRFARINAPEIQTYNGKEAKTFLTGLLPTGENGIHIQVLGQDKYGRWLAEILVGKININDEMLKSNHAILYEEY